MSVIVIPRQFRRARTGFATTLVTAFALILAALPAAMPGPAYAGPGLMAAQAISNARQALIDQAEPTEPFGRLSSTVMDDGPLVDKWQAVRRAIAAEMTLITLCRTNVALCPSPAAVEFLSIVERARIRDGLARAGEINRAINLDVRPASDLDQYHVADFWSSPLATLTAGAGDCEDYAIAKLIALREAGIPPQDLRLVILRDRNSQEDHAVVAVRIDNRWRVLDSRRLPMLDDAQFSHFQPIFAIDDAGIRRYADSSEVSASAAALQPYF
jgi:predicted transglutaminase-like cysteine proteinase